MRIRIRSVSGATPELTRPIVTTNGRAYVDIVDLADLWRLRAETEHLIAIDTTDNEGNVLLVIDDYLD
jgi:hypothetical protein